MTLQLAVRITGDASSLKQEAAETRRVTDGLGTSLDAVGDKAAGAARKLDGAADATNRLGAAERGAAGAANPNGRGPSSGGSGGPSAPPGPSSPPTAPGVPPARPGASTPTAPVAPPTPRPVPTTSARTSLRPDQWTNLGYQANDIGTTLAMGMSPLMVMAQQGPQVAQILSDAPGGIAGGLRIVAERAAAILTPVRLLTGGFVGLGGTVAYLGYQWSQSQSQIEKGLTGIGAMSRATVGDINRIAEVATSGNRLSTGQARGVASAIASTGRVDVSNIGAVTGLAPGYAEMFGKSIGDAGEDLARIFADPIKGAEELNARIGGLDDRTRQYIKTLVEQGDRQEAIRAIVRAFSPDLDEAAKKTGLWAKAWNAVSSAAGAVGAFVARPFVTLPDDQRLADVERQLSSAEAQRDAGGFGDFTKEIERLTRERDELRKQIAEQAARTEQKIAAELGTQGADAVRALQPEIAQLEILRTRIELLTKVDGDAAAKAGMSAEARRAHGAALAAAQGGVDTFISAQDRARASEALTIRSIEARTEAEKAAVAAERERLALAGQAISENDRRQRIEAARAASFAQGSREAQDRLTEARDRAAGAGLPSYQRQLAELEARTRKALRGAEGNLPAYAATQQTAAAERAAIDAEAIGGPLREANRSVTEQAAGLRIQQQAFGASTEAAARMAAAQQLVNQYVAAGVPITADLQRGIDAYAASAGKVAAAQDDLVRKQREVVGGLDDVRFGLRGGITGTFSDLAAGKSPLAGILNTVNRTTSSMVDRMVSGPLTGALFGGEGKAGGGLFGDALGGVLGKAAGLPTADITAGVVNLSGPIAGIPGISAANSNVPSAASVAAGMGGKGSAEAASSIVSKLSGSRAEVAEYVKRAALERGIDPNTALRVVNQESGFNVAAKNLTAREQSYGVMQLNTMGGLGVDAVKAGIDVRDPSTWRRQVDFGLDTVKRDGWRQWYGARDIGISRWEGIGQGGSATSATSSALPNLDASLRSIEGTATRATEGVTGLTANLSSLPAPLAQTSQGLTQVGQSLGSGGGGGGLLGAIASLFTGGASAAPASVAAATGGLILGPGTGTSDSITARLSNGEFVTNAAATSRHLPLLRAINDNRMPAFAEGGYVGAVPPAARWDAPARVAAAGAAGAPGGNLLTVNINNAPSTPRVEEVADGRGQRRLEVTFDEAAAQAVGRPGSKTGAALQAPKVASR